VTVLQRDGRVPQNAGSVSKDCKNRVRASQAGWQADECCNGRQEEPLRGMCSGHTFHRER
jgi:hypothetical protein